MHKDLIRPAGIVTNIRKFGLLSAQSCLYRAGVFAEMAVDQGRGQIRVSIQNSIKNGLMVGAAIDGHTAPRRGDGHVSDPMRLVQIAHRAQPTVSMCGDSGVVEIAVGGFPVLCAFGRYGFFDAGQTVMGGNQIGFPSGVTLLGCGALAIIPCPLG